MSENNCIAEANFELIEQTPITLDLEVKQYFDGAGQQIRELLFEETQWDELAESEYSITFNREQHFLETLAITSIMLWNEETNTYRPALFDYTIKNILDSSETLIDIEVTLFSEYPCKGKLILFGQVLTVN